MNGLPATPELAAQLSERLDIWAGVLARLPDTPASAQSRRLLDNYRRTLSRDMARGLERVPAAELFRAIATAEAATKQVQQGQP